MRRPINKYEHANLVLHIQSSRAVSKHVDFDIAPKPHSEAKLEQLDGNLRLFSRGIIS